MSTCEITPLGAAVVEALPDRKAAAAIQRTFKRTGKCPTSTLFPTEKDVAEFYKHLLKG